MERIKRFCKNLHPTLKELLCGIFLWGLLLALVLVWFSDSKPAFLLSLFAGVLAAAGMAFHMCHFIEDSLELTQEDASRHMKKGTVLRIAAAMVLAVLVWLLDGDIVAVFLGLLTLKLGAYTQPLIHRLTGRAKKA
ncbi:hypothetical protein BRYFOR_05641 [Marvinbryantia formatexigens DSM 14469]|uniref:ATP synthase I chain n=1 Tax=Marvinbryantia formatexigens DSM 14469 TaxID=478749 RepID=C6LAJ9_9FIRM|nr:ATP synthase subunit I [Marvinbryantia formatexigens]EET62606.1 hypothetical protein BRYFOR_05641 [Marvinbryantia formatexigens DSM 14469]UWO23240.1 ATP synthase subunit I [Marvinbryantia formatexigens DSM 14469]SDG60574.1 ATP synthase I chain [Marvinbryantia formatexigens]